MTKDFNSQNERIKREYFQYQSAAKRKCPATLDGIRKAILRFEEYIGFKDLWTFNKEQAIAFKKHLAELKSERTGEPLSKVTMLSTINALKDFFAWIAYKPGYKSRINVPDIEYLNLSEKETRVAKAGKMRDIPTLEQVRRVIFNMPIATDIERRNRALVAITVLTGMRDSAIASLRLKHIDLSKELVKQEPDQVKTKFSKRIDTFFFPVGDDIKVIVVDWVRELKEEKMYGLNDPVFPKTKLGQDANHSFKPLGLEPQCWTTASPIRDVFKEAFIGAGLPYFHPHSFRHLLVHLAQSFCKTPEQLKAWSQNLGHEHVMTTLNSYGHLSPHQQGDVIRRLTQSDSRDEKIDRLLNRLDEKLL